MPYELVFSEVAEADFERMPQELRVDFAIRLDDLAEHPTHNTRPSLCPPYWPNHQMREFSAEHDDRLFRCVILFKYMADERSLWIAALGYHEISRP